MIHALFRTSTLSRQQRFQLLKLLLLALVGILLISAHVDEFPESEARAGTLRSGSDSVSTAKEATHPQPSSYRAAIERSKIGESDSPFHFVIAGFQKCGTTFLQRHLSNASDFFVPEKELHSSELAGPQQLDAVFADAPTSAIRRGYKVPSFLASHKYLSLIEEHYPRTKFVVTLRHPILWYQSWYNYKMKGNGGVMRPWQETVGVCHEACIHSDLTCSPSDQFGCAGSSAFHLYLSRLGLTPMNTEREQVLLGNHSMSIHNFRSGHEDKPLLFLTEIGQLDFYTGEDNIEEDEIPVNRVLADLEVYLNLDEATTAKIPRKELTKNWIPDHSRPKQNKELKTTTTLPERQPIDICEPAFQDLRTYLLEVGRNASAWIEDYLLLSPLVVVPERDDFLLRIRQWRQDPCI